MIAKLASMGHPEAYRYRLNYFLACYEAATEEAAERMRLAAIAHRASRAGDQEFERFVNPPRPLSDREIEEKFGAKRSEDG